MAELASNSGAAAPAVAPPPPTTGNALLDYVLSAGLSDAVFSCLSFRDATPVRGVCRALRDALAECPFVAAGDSASDPLQAPGGLADAVRGGAANLARWRACFPAARSLIVDDSERHGGARRLTDADVAAAVTPRPGRGGEITRATLADCDGLSDGVLEALATCRSVTLYFCPRVTGRGLRALRGVTRLVLLGTGPVCDDDLAHLGPSVRHVSVYCVDDSTVGAGGLRHLGGVRSLEVEVTSPERVGELLSGDVFEALPQLTRLMLRVSAKSSSQETAPRPLGPPRWDVFRHLAGRLACLHLSIDLGDTLPLHERVLAPLGGSLRELTLVHLAAVTDAMLLHALRVVSLTVERCDAVVGDALSSSLEELVVTDCNGFTGTGLPACCPRLASLRVRGCPLFSTATLASVAAGCAALARLHVSTDRADFAYLGRPSPPPGAWALDAEYAHAVLGPEWRVRRSSPSTFTAERDGAPWRPPRGDDD
jgi:hypothetical protein